MKDVVRTDYSKVRTWKHNNGYTYNWYADTEHFIVWKTEGRWPKYEVWKKHYIKNPDGSLIVSKVGDEQMGRYGWFCNDVPGVLTLAKRKIRDGEETWGEIVSLFAR